MPLAVRKATGENRSLDARGVSRTGRGSCIRQYSRRHQLAPHPTNPKYLHRHATGKTLVRVVPAPFWIDSKTTAGSQVADIVAHTLMNSMMPPAERKPIEFLWQKVMALMGGDGTYRTITKIMRTPTGRD